MTAEGQRELVRLKLQSANRKLGEAARDLDLVGDLALAMCRDALAVMDFDTFLSAVGGVERGCRSYWGKAAVRDAVDDIKEALMIARQPVEA